VIIILIVNEKLSAQKNFQPSGSFRSQVSVRKSHNSAKYSDIVDVT